MNARTWLADVREHADPHLTCILVGNKVDLCEDSNPAADATASTTLPTSTAVAPPPRLNPSPSPSKRGSAAASLKRKAREVSYEEAALWAKEEGLLFVEASAKSGQNVELAFVQASQDILIKIRNGVFDDDRVSFKGLLSNESDPYAL